MSVNKVKLSTGETLIDLTGDSVTPEKLASGVTAHNKSGVKITGTAKIGKAENWVVTYKNGSTETKAVFVE